MADGASQETLTNPVARRTGVTHYTPNTGTGALRAAIARKLADENGLEYSASEVVVTNGAKQAIWQGLLAVCSPGDEARSLRLAQPVLAAR